MGSAFFANYYSTMNLQSNFGTLLEKTACYIYDRVDTSEYSSITSTIEECIDECKSNSLQTTAFVTLGLQSYCCYIYPSSSGFSCKKGLYDSGGDFKFK